MPPTPTIREALRQAEEAFTESSIQAPRLTAEVLLQYVLGQDKAYLFAHADLMLTGDQWRQFVEAGEERRKGKPTQYITGWQEFYGLAFHVTPDVMIPRPETELLVEETITRAGDDDRILDVGTGSGCLAITLALKLLSTSVTACDVSAAALSVARTNAERLRARVRFAQTSLVSAFRGEAFDIIVSNPPYVPAGDRANLQREVRDYEPEVSLYGGPNGLDCYRELARSAPCVLRPGGSLLLEIGYNQRQAVEQLLSGSEWENPRTQQDLAGRDRVVAVRRRPGDGGRVY